MKTCILVDPRFPGGTSSAVAQEIPVLAGLGELDVSVAWMRTRMFRGDHVNPKLEKAALEAGLRPEWTDVIRSRTVILHNPAALKFDATLPLRVICDKLMVVCHENLLRPDGREGFAVGHVLEQLRKGSLARSRILVPISPWNRKTVVDWCARNPLEARHWIIAGEDWFNICDFPIADPGEPRADRRGRMSRPGFEKFPDPDTMRLLFPDHAEACRILGGDSLLALPELPAHWEVLPFGSMLPDRFLETIDFFVYFTNPRWRESFGRVIAEAIAAGKTVITDPETARIFGPNVIGCSPAEVDAAIARALADPAAARRRVLAAQEDLRRFHPEHFRETALRLLLETEHPTTLAPGILSQA